MQHPYTKKFDQVKLDFSATNFKGKVTGWHLSIEKKVDVLFPTVCEAARGIVAATTGSAQLDHQDPQILARANLPSEDEDTAMEHEKDIIQAIDEDHNNSRVHKHHRNGGDDLDGYDDGDELDSNDDGGDDSDGHDYRGDNSDGHYNKGDNMIGTEEGPNSSGGGGGYYDDQNDETERNDSKGSDLTKISSSSDDGKVVENSRKRVQHGRH